MSVASEFKEFAMKGNVVDLAGGVIVGAAFGKIVSSLVGNVVMPVLGHATWHLYRRAVEPDPNPHPDYQPR